MITRKSSPEDLIQEIADKLIIYLKAGTLNTGSFIKKLDLNIKDFNQLLRIHFLLKEKVQNFVQKLPWRIRNIKTSTKTINQFLRGEVRGRVTWQQTIKKRCETNYLNNGLFVCQQNDINFNIKENLVLKKLLSIINDILSNDLNIWQENYSWLADWLGDRKLANVINEIYVKNIYLRKINIEDVIITERMIQDTKTSRNILYKEAAELLNFYSNIVDFNNWGDMREEIIKMLNKTFIKPQKEDVLFELYWVIKLVEANSKNSDLNLIDGRQNLVANWSKQGKEYYVYHDSTGSGKLNFKVALKELKNITNDYLSRRIKGRIIASEIAKDVFNKEMKKNIWEGRPDIVIEVYDKNTGRLVEVIIGEIKYTNNYETTKQGLKELIDYCSLIKEQNNYVHNNELDVSKFNVTGLLLLDKIPNAEDQLVSGLKIYYDCNTNTWQTEAYKDREIII